MNCHLAMTLCFFSLISLNFFFLHFASCSRQRKKFCMYVTFFHPTISHCFAGEKQLRLSYIFFTFLQTAYLVLTRGEQLFSNYSEESGNSDCVLLSRRPEPEWIRDPTIFICQRRRRLRSYP